MVRKQRIQKGLLSGGLLWALLLVAGSADGMVYTWCDGAGTAHYTNKEYEIPSRYRTRAKRIYPEVADIKSGSTTNAVQTSATVQPLVAPTVNLPAAENSPAVLPEKGEASPPSVPAQKPIAPATSQKGKRQRILTGDE